MVMIAHDVPQIDDYLRSGIGQRFLTPSAVHLVLTNEELEQYKGLYRGSGGSITGFFSDTLSGANNIPAELANQESNLIKAINIITSTFSLTKDELAQVCKVSSRKTLYNWIDGTSKPQKRTLKRIFELVVIAKDWKYSGFPNDKKYMHIPIFEDLSLIDLLSKEELNKEQILFAGSRLNLSVENTPSLMDPFA